MMAVRYTVILLLSLLVAFGITYINYRFILNLENISFFYFLIPILAGFVCGIVIVIFLNKLNSLRESEKKIRDMAFTDELTGLPNRRSLLDLLDFELKRARRFYTPLSIALLDLDDFKQINDRYGHLIGDEVLKEMARVLRSCLRSTDIVGRFGGEEFMIIMPATSFKTAVKVMERVREAVEHTFFEPVGSVSISIGVTELREEDSAQDLITRADENLYKAKREGKNRVIAG